mmetsp:Transcript_13124/g.35939  ORF Transcript_13124/g.35939 Transcript_13124/m.35939 type:complete len:90 (-) Transcript_13124:56-325(-)
MAFLNAALMASEMTPTRLTDPQEGCKASTRILMALWQIPLVCGRSDRALCAFSPHRLFAFIICRRQEEGSGKLAADLGGRGRSAKHLAL